MLGFGRQHGRLAAAMLRKLNEKSLSYVRELVFILRNCVDWRSRTTFVCKYSSVSFGKLAKEEPEWSRRRLFGADQGRI